MAEAAPKPKQLRGYVEDESPSSSSTPAVDLSAASLTIKDEGETEEEKPLDEPDDSNIQAISDTPYTSASTFEALNLSPELLRGVYSEMKFQRPNKIQATSLPMILTPPHKNLISETDNGSGNTNCFVLGMLSRIDPKTQVPQALCICPTRELAIQNLKVLCKMGKHTGIESECAIPVDRSDSKFSQRPPVKAQVVIGTPGTIKKWMVYRKLGVSNMKILVFDEADHMLSEDGFEDDSLRIMKNIERSGAQCQVLLFSAAFNEMVKNFVTRIVKDYNSLLMKKEELSLESVKQYRVKCPNERSKILMIKDKIFKLGQKVGQTIVFVTTEHSAEMLNDALVEYGYEVTTIRGALRQEDRDKIIKEFKDGLTQVLISTDPLACGFDQSRVNLVINYDLPFKHHNRAPDYEVYLHRIGGAGPFGHKGAVFNLLCTKNDNLLMSRIENRFGFQIPEILSWQKDEDYEAVLKDAGLC